METILIESAIAGATTSIVANSVNAQPLLTALIGFGVSIVTMVGGELVKFLVSWFKKKTKDLDVKEETEKEDDDTKE